MPKKTARQPVEDFTRLRSEAEKLLTGAGGDAGPISSQGDQGDLLHELHVHQIELEMQNEQLRYANEELETQRDKFAGLYDLAPVGYFILDEYGIVKELNNTGCAMLDMPRGGMVGKNFLNFIDDNDSAVFINFLESIQLYQKRDSCRLTMLKRDSKFYAQLEGKVNLQDEAEKIRCYVAVIDITDRKSAEIDHEKAILAATINSQENERKRISESLHDSVGQLLYGIKLKMDELDISAGYYKEVHRLLDQAIQETRNISFELAPSILKDFGLSISLSEMARRLSTEHLSLQVHTELGGRLDFGMEVAIFRIVQELVNNSIKHAAASVISVAVKRSDNIIIEVSDNGKGFDDKSSRPIPKGTGLAAIRNRISLYSGKMQIDARKPTGCRVQIILTEN